MSYALRNLLTLTVVALGLSLTYLPNAKAESDEGTCNTSSSPGFACESRCPNPPAGVRYLELDCRCDKNKRARTCTASGICEEYTLGGIATGNAVDCLCDKYDTVYEGTE